MDCEYEGQFNGGGDGDDAKYLADGVGADDDADDKEHSL